jgi:hypothetical protein
MAELSLKTASLTSWKELVKALPDIFGAVKVEAAVKVVDGMKSDQLASLREVMTKVWGLERCPDECLLGVSLVVLDRSAVIKKNGSAYGSRTLLSLLGEELGPRTTTRRSKRVTNKGTTKTSTDGGISATEFFRGLSGDLGDL